MLLLEWLKAICCDCWIASAAFIVKLDKFILITPPTRLSEIDLKVINLLLRISFLICYPLSSKANSILKSTARMSYKFKFNCLKFSSLAFFLLLFQVATSQRNNKNVKELGITNFPDLDAMVVAKQKQMGNNLVVMVWTDTLVYKRELGDFDAKTVAPIASCSKWLTTALILQLVDEGKLSLDDKVNQYIPLFATYNKNYITIRQCLSHMTGIKSEPFTLARLLSSKKYSSLEEEVNDYAKREIQNNPGVEFRYSEVGINIAARVAEIVGKKKFDMLIRQKLFLPLAMRQTTFSTLDGSAPNPSGGATSSANDYMHFLTMLLHNGMYNGQRVLSEASIKLLRQIQTSPELIKYAPISAQGFNYALGSWVLDARQAGEATALSSPGLFGTWPIVDWCHGYAFLFFTKTLLNEQKATDYMQMREMLDDKYKSKCQ
jgi:CubicO group peptidase (beta-lactamase class C family)